RNPKESSLLHLNSLLLLVFQKRLLWNVLRMQSHKTPSNLSILKALKMDAAESWLPSCGGWVNRHFAASCLLSIRLNARSQDAEQSGSWRQRTSPPIEDLGPMPFQTAYFYEPTFIRFLTLL